MKWKELVIEALSELGGGATLKELTEKLKNNPQRPQTVTWQATIRRVVRQYKIFEPYKTTQGQAAYRLANNADSEIADFSHIDSHGEQQGMLLRIGQICGYETFTNNTDKTIRRIDKSSIAQFATVRNDAQSLRGLPLDKIRTIDVMWLSEDTEGLYPRFAFEVEESTKVKNGLIRLLRIPSRYQTSLYIIGKSDEEKRLFDRYIVDSPFREHRNLIHFPKFDDVRSFYESATAFEVNINKFGIGLYN
jgi:hypothetical protein